MCKPITPGWVSGFRGHQRGAGHDLPVSRSNCDCHVDGEERDWKISKLTSIFNDRYEDLGMCVSECACWSARVCVCVCVCERERESLCA